MPEWVRDTSGTALKTTDSMLDRIGDLYAQLALKDLEIEGLKAELMVAVEAALVNR
jgi:hypothetical protein